MIKKTPLVKVGHLGLIGKALISALLLLSFVRDTAGAPLPYTVTNDSGTVTAASNATGGTGTPAVSGTGGNDVRGDRASACRAKVRVLQNYRR